MSNRKLRFNMIDVLIILLVIAAIAVLYIMVFSGRGNQTAEIKYTTIRYVVEVQDVAKNTDEMIKKGQLVEDAVERKKIGTVAGVQTSPFAKLTYDYEKDTQVSSVVEDRDTLKITIEAKAQETDRAFTVDGCEIRVGQQYSVMLPDFYGIGYCVELVTSSERAG